MLPTYLKVALRHLFRSKAYSAINIVGLALGFAACFVILVYVSYQLSFDRVHEHRDEIAVVTSRTAVSGWTEPQTPLALAGAMQAEIPEIREIARCSRRRTTIVVGGERQADWSCAYADPELFDILTLPLTEGAVPRGKEDFLILSESTARRFFGAADPLGKTVRLEIGKEGYDLAVSGIMKDLPATSTFQATLIAPLRIEEAHIVTSYTFYGPEVSLPWTVQAAVTYVLLPPGTDLGTVRPKLSAIAKSHQSPARPMTFDFFPFKDVYFHSSFMMNVDWRRGNLANLYAYSAAALLLLFTAAVNYLMLALGRASLRTKDVGVRRVLGATRTDLLRQHTTEALLIAVLSLPLAVILEELALPKLTELMGVRIETAFVHQWGFVLAFLCVVILVGMIAGCYVALHLAGQSPLALFRRGTGSGQQKSLQRRLLLGSQMVIFLALTLCSIVIYRQLRYCQDFDLGYAPSSLLAFTAEADSFAVHFPLLKAELQKVPDILAVSGAFFAPASGSRALTRFPRADDPSQLVAIEGMAVERDFIETMGMQIVDGLSFAARPAGSATSDIILNETAVRALGLASPVDKIVGGSRVIGVVKDFVYHSLHEPVGPLRLNQDPMYLHEVVVKAAPGHMAEVARRVQEAAAPFNEGKPLEYQPWDERWGDLYVRDKKFATVVGAASGLAILVACLGLLGMSMFICQQRTKEVGIRKVLGASVFSLGFSLMKESLGLLVLASVAAFPVAAYLMNRWLQDFAYRITIGPGDVLLALVCGALVVVAAMGVQVSRSARANPVESLRYE